MLIPPKPGCDLYEALGKYSGQAVYHTFWAGDESTSSTAVEDTLRKRQWRISSEQILALRETGKMFEGTHNFHNFTVGRDHADKSSQRHMKKIEVGEWFVND